MGYAPGHINETNEAQEKDTAERRMTMGEDDQLAALFRQPLYLALFDGAGRELTAKGYARQAVQFVAGRMEGYNNTEHISFGQTEVAWGEIVFIGLAALSSGPCLADALDRLTSPVFIHAKDTLIFAAGDIHITPAYLQALKEG